MQAYVNSTSHHRVISPSACTPSSPVSPFSEEARVCAAYGGCKYFIPVDPHKVLNLIFLKRQVIKCFKGSYFHL